MESWFNISDATYESFCSAENTLLSQEELMKALSAEGLRDNERAMVIFELIYSVVNFCQRKEFNYEKTLQVLSIYGSVFSSHIASTSTEKDSTAMKASCVDIFTGQIKRGNLFHVEECKQIAEFFSSTIIRNFDAYRFVMANFPREEVRKQVLTVQTPLGSLPPLSSSIDPEELGGGSVTSSLADGSLG